MSSREAKRTPNAGLTGRGYRLKDKEEPVEGIVRIATGRAEKALEALRRAGEGDDLAASVHSARKDLKKLRSVLRLVRPALGERQFSREHKRYRDAARRLSASRDAEVKLRTLSALEERSGKELPGEAVNAWRALLAAEREELGDVGKLATQLQGAMGEIEVGRDEIARWKLSGDSWGLVAPGLGRTYKRGRREMKRVRDGHEAGDVHQWRKRVKDLWYQLRLLAGMWPALLGETAGQAHDLADLLGDHHDLTVLGDDLQTREMGDERKILTAIERRQEELLASALDLGERLYAEKPKAFLRRLSAYWASWRG